MLNGCLILFEPKSEQMKKVYVAIKVRFFILNRHLSIEMLLKRL